jgi:hypothetical protein
VNYSDYAEQLEIQVNECLSEFAHKGTTDYFYNCLSDFVEIALTEKADPETEIRVHDHLKVMMEVLYSLDTGRIQDWDSFAETFKKGSRPVTHRDHRKPPKPKWFHIAQPGQCRYCGEMVTNADGRVNRRANWHKPCLRQYKLIYWPDQTKRAVWKRDRGQCIECGEITAEWDMDHRQPLIESKGDMAFWSLGNCTTLCRPCHKDKTAREATERARLRRELKQQNKDQ